MGSGPESASGCPQRRLELDELASTPSCGQGREAAAPAVVASRALSATITPDRLTATSPQPRGTIPVTSPALAIPHIKQSPVEERWRTYGDGVETPVQRLRDLDALAARHPSRRHAPATRRSFPCGGRLPTALSPPRCGSATPARACPRASERSAGPVAAPGENCLTPSPPATTGGELAAAHAAVAYPRLRGPLAPAFPSRRHVPARCVSVTAGQGLVVRPDLASVLDPPQTGLPAAARGGACGLAASAGGSAAG